MKNTHKQYQTRLQQDREFALKRKQTITPTRSDNITDPHQYLKLWCAQVEQREIEQAQLRLGEGQLGICQECDQAIPPERLEIFPYAKRCVACQQQADARHT